jgi:hypothetical protein
MCSWATQRAAERNTPLAAHLAAREESDRVHLRTDDYLSMHIRLHAHEATMGRAARLAAREERVCIHICTHVYVQLCPYLYADVYTRSSD